MLRRNRVDRSRLSWRAHVTMLVILSITGGTGFGGEPLRPGSELNVRSIGFQIVYESLREKDGRENWELILIDADGSNPRNLTGTGEISEMYPHVSPNGRKVCFVADEGSGRQRVRSVYCMNLDGTGRVKVAHNARQPCWGPDGRTLAYLKGEYARYTTRDYASKGVFLYDLRTGEHTAHPNHEKLYHLYNLCWSPCGKWFLATVHGGMGFDHAILAFEADGAQIVDLTPCDVTGCRPDFSPDGKMVTWGKTDWDLCVGTIDVQADPPAVANVRGIVKCDKNHEVYHTDFSPDGQYIAFSYGPKAKEQVGEKAPGWNICITDLEGHWVQVTTDGRHNKEPDWVPTRQAAP